MIAHVFNAASGRDMGWVVTVPDEGFSVGQVIWNNGRRYEIAKIVRDHLFVWKPVLSAGKRKVEGTLREMVESSAPLPADVPELEKAKQPTDQFNPLFALAEHNKLLRILIAEEERIRLGFDPQFDISGRYGSDPGDENHDR